MALSAAEPVTDAWERLRGVAEFDVVVDLLSLPPPPPFVPPAFAEVPLMDMSLFSRFTVPIPGTTGGDNWWDVCGECCCCLTRG